MDWIISLWRSLLASRKRFPNWPPIPLGPRPFQTIFFLAAGRLLDVVATCFWSAALTRRPLDPDSDVDDWSDEAIIEAYQKEYKDPTIPLPTYFAYVKALTPRTLIKLCNGFREPVPPEVHSIRLVCSQTTIPVPAIHRYAHTHTEYTYADRDTGIQKNGVKHRHAIAMQRINGQPLAECWTSLSWWTKLRVIWTLRQYISQLRRIPNPIPDRPGPLGDSSYRPPDGDVFCNTAETFDTVEDLTNWFVRRAQPLPQKDGSPTPIPPFPDATPLVFTHGDLHLGNIILDISGCVWVIDWQFSGFYPRWFEYLMTKRVACEIGTPTSWRLLLPLIAGPSFANESWIENMRILRYQWGQDQGDPKPAKLPFPGPTPFVLTHGDIHPGNVLLDMSGRVWLLDWGCAGFYPRWSEYLTAVQVAYNVKVPASWRLLLPLITGPSLLNKAWLKIYTPSEDRHDIGLDVLYLGIKKWLRSKVRGLDEERPSAEVVLASHLS